MKNLIIPKSKNNTQREINFLLTFLFKSRFSRILLLLLILAAARQLSIAAPGDLDLTFGAGGKALTNIGASAVSGRAMIIQPDGKIVVAGATDLNNPGSDFLVLRYNANGTLDTAFDLDGKVTTDFNGKSDAAFALAIQTDGKIVVAGMSGTSGSDRDFAIARYNADGSLDSSFDGDGRAVTDFGNLNDEAYAVAIAPSGKIVAAGTTSSRNGDFAVARYNADGALDATFGTGGLVTSDAFCVGNCNNTIDRARGMAIYPDGRIVVAGDAKTVSVGDTPRFAAARYLDSGAPDGSFNSFGKATLSSGNGDLTATAMALQPDGKIVVVGATSTSSTQPPRSLVIDRFTAAGTFDSAFSRSTTLIPNSGQTNYQPNSVAVQSDGKIVVAGNYGANFLIARYAPGGAVDSFFGNGGFVITAMNSAATGGGAFAVNLQTDGKIVAAGHQQSSSGGEIAVARYSADGCSSAFTSSSSIFLQRVQSERNVFVSSPAGCQWNVVSGASWLTVTSGNPGSGNGTVTIRATLNTTTQPRSTTLTVGSNVIEVTQAFGVGIPKRVRFDLDNDGRADVGVARLMNAQHINFYTLSSARGFITTPFFVSSSVSLTNAKIVPADYDGDGRMDYAVWTTDSANQGTFRIIYDYGSAQTAVFGLLGDVPVSADFDGDGLADLAVYRSGTATAPQSYFYYRPSGSPGVNFVTVPWGTVNDKPVVGDFDGDGKNDPAVYRPANGGWYILRSSDGVLSGVQFGISTDKLVPADYDGDGKTDVAVVRDGNWYLLQSTGGFRGVSFGFGSDTPVPADYDGDGKTDIAVFRNGVWYLLQSTNGFQGIQFGFGSDTPLAAAYLQ